MPRLAKRTCLVGTEFLFILPFVFDQVGIVFAVVRILFLIDGMPAAPVFPVAMRVIDLCVASFQETTPQLRKTVSGADVDVEGVEFMLYALAGLRHIHGIALDLIRRPDEKLEVFGHIPLNGRTQVDVSALLDHTFIKLAAQAIPPDVCIHHQHVILIPVDGSTQEHKVFLQEETGEVRRKVTDIITVRGGPERPHVDIFERVSAADPVAVKFDMKRGFQGYVECLVLEADVRGIRTDEKSAGLHRVPVRLNFVEPVGIPGADIPGRKKLGD